MMHGLWKRPGKSPEVMREVGTKAPNSQGNVKLRLDDSHAPNSSTTDVTTPSPACVKTNRLSETTLSPLVALLERYGLSLARVADDAPIPGSYWGDSEAGLIGQVIYARADTPLHSLLHETAHVICMDDARRENLHTDAGGDYAEEDAVCFLQIILAGVLGVPMPAICADMDAWGYTFRLGSARAWFEEDAGDALTWLVRHGLVTAQGELLFQKRAA